MKHYNIPIFINHYGCPNSCVFCNQKKINGVETDMTVPEIHNIINTNLATIPKDGIKEVAFFGGTFTGLSLKLQELYLETIQKYIENGDIDGIRISTRPDCINDEILAMLKKYNVKLIELGIQSLDEMVLKKTGRNYTEEIVWNTVNLIKNYSINLGVQMMIGLPGSDFDSDYETCKKLTSMKPDVARIYPTLVINNTELENMYKSLEYIPLTLEKSIEISKKIYSFFQINGINVIRVGLQPSEDLRRDGIIVDGPFHPAFRDLVLNEIYFDFLHYIYNKAQKLYIITHEKNISSIVGNKGKNKDYFKNNFRIIKDNSLSVDDFVINDERYNKNEIYRFQVDRPRWSEII
ncbi:MAG: radical SAM protein [Fusobacteriaceae bacterium]|jgi:histone acetyltransferase (RNA polymerase elongator complex component)|nr:radical SAM protein [Fusobacteriaceae bacterium]